MNISSQRLRFVYLHQRKYVEATMYPYFTMLGQSFGSLILGKWEYVEAAMYPYFTMLGQSFGSLILGKWEFVIKDTVVCVFGDFKKRNNSYK